MISRSQKSRRNFIKTVGCGAMGSTTLMSTLANLMVSNKIIAASSSPPNDYKALVCILLAGGNDSYNMLIPRNNEGTTDPNHPDYHKEPNFYNQYAATRTNLAIPQSDLLPIHLGGISTNTDALGRQFGIHPSMGGAYGGLQGLFNNGRAAFVANVGTLIEPVPDKAAYQNSNTNLPLGLYSHSDQIQQWQTATPQSRQAIGWGGKIADILQSTTPYNGQNQNISMKILKL